MEITDAMIDADLKEIQEALELCKSKDGSYCVSGVNRERVIIALEFAKSEISKAIEQENNQ